VTFLQKRSPFKNIWANLLSGNTVSNFDSFFEFKQEFRMLASERSAKILESSKQNLEHRFLISTLNPRMFPEIAELKKRGLEN
jgi:hypothetical protein